MRAFKSLESFAYVTKRLSRHFLDVLRHGRGMTLTNGNALAGRLAKAAMDLNIPVWLSSPVQKLVVEYDGVAGAIVQREGKRIRVNAKRGVVLACGGFPHDIERRKALFPHAPTGKEHFSPAPEANTGDGLRLAEAVGGTRRRHDSQRRGLGADLGDDAAGRQQGRDAALHRPRQAGRDRRHAARASASPTKATRTTTSSRTWSRPHKGEPEVSAWLLCDHRVLRNYGLGCVAPFPLPDRPPPEDRLPEARRDHRRAGQADRRRCPRCLQATVDEFNRHARKGEDPAFGKGSKAYNRYQGDELSAAESVRRAAGAGPVLRDQAGRRRHRHLRRARHRREDPRPGRWPADRSRACTRSATTLPA